MNKIKIHTQFQKISADILTPVNLFLKIRDRYTHPLLLESSDNHAAQNNYSYICFDPLSTFSAKDGVFKINDIPQNNVFNLDEAMQAFISRFETEPMEFPFLHHGLFGYTGYNAIPYNEQIEFDRNKNIENIPDVFYAVYRYVLVFNHYYDELYVFCNDMDASSIQPNLHNIINLIENKTITQHSFNKINDEEQEITDNDFKELVTKAKKHTQRGDVFQIVLSRKFKQAFHGDEFNVYRALRHVNPSPYLFYFDYGSFKLFGSSPESQLIINKNIAIVHPIAGTVKRTGNDSLDMILAEKLKKDPKENAEHVMLVDLARNDMSKHCTNVSLNYYKELHFYSHVIHMVSEIKGTLKNDCSPYKVLLDSFPAGTLSGAPKHKAMQLINQYEISARSFYGGCIGMIGFDGSLHHAILIRSFLSKGNYLNYQAGAGIVSSSQEENELQEINNKINALRQAIQFANKPTNLITSNNNLHEEITGT